MPIIGTAGHVDHGKSTLVHALTGRDPDRWEEEKRRGLTIDLGFAWADLGGGEEVAFVDVPGHERFIKNMLAGIEAIDVALLVVAADEGWMPQSEEHLAVLDLLDVGRGVVAVTKADRVDQELLGLVVAEVEDRLAGTSLTRAAIVPVSVPEQRGIEEVGKALEQALAAPSPAPDSKHARLWVDRSFTISGAGTVVTGTLLGDSLTVGEDVAIWPAGRRARIRGLQTHERTRDTVAPSNRVAVNLAGPERSDIARGSMLGHLGEWRTTDVLLADLRLARYVDHPLSERGAYHLHLGSSAQPVRVRPLEGREIRDRGAVLIRLERPLPIAAGDRFILREVGRRIVVAGGRTLDPAPPSSTEELRASLEILRGAANGSPDERATALLGVRRSISLGELAAQTAGGRPTSAMVVAGQAVSAAEAERLAEEAFRLVDRYHRDNPLRPGFPKATLASRLELSREVLEALVATDGRLEDRGPVTARAGFENELGEEDRRAWEPARRSIEEAGWMVPRLNELGLDEELVQALVREQHLVRVGEDLAYLPDRLAGLPVLLDSLRQPFTVADFRDALGISRKYAVPLLEWLDRQGVTARVGDLRRIRRPESAR